MSKILLFDDRPQVRMSLEEKLRSYCDGIEVFSCRSVYEATDTWNRMKNDLDAIVIDMMLPSLGLDESLRSKTQGGLLTGWIWLWHNINKQNEDPHPATDKCIVIYSAYLKDFDKYITSAFPSDAEKLFAKKARLMPKGNSGKENDVVDLLVDYFCEIGTITKA